MSHTGKCLKCGISHSDLSRGKAAFLRYKTVPLLYLPCDIELVEYNQKREMDSRLQGGNTYGSNFKGCWP